MHLQACTHTCPHTCTDTAPDVLPSGRTCRAFCRLAEAPWQPQGIGELQGLSPASPFQPPHVLAAPPPGRFMQALASLSSSIRRGGPQGSPQRTSGTREPHVDGGVFIITPSQPQATPSLPPKHPLSHPGERLAVLGLPAQRSSLVHLSHPRRREGPRGQQALLPVPTRGPCASADRLCVGSTGQADPRENTTPVCVLSNLLSRTGGSHFLENF